MVRECPVAGCKEVTPRTRFLCRRHWYQVPVIQRRAVNDAWRHYQDVTGRYRAASTAIKIAAIQALSKAQRAALAAVEEVNNA